MSRMRVARIITRMNVGGPAKQVEVLDELPVDTYLIHGRCDEGEHEYATRGSRTATYEVPELKREVGLVNDWRAYRRIKQILRDIQPDLVHTHISKAGLLGRVAAWRLGIPSVHTYHGNVFHSYFGRCKTAIIKMVERKLAGITTRIIAICPSQRRELVGVIGSRDKIRVVWNGFDLEPFKEVYKINKDEAIERMGWRLDCIVYLWVGRKAPIKRFDKFMEYVDASIAHPRSIGPVVFEAMDLSASDLALAYRAADKFVMCSDNEGTPTAYIEARVAGARIELLTRPGGLKDLVIMSRDKIIETFSADRLKQDIMELYKEVVDD